jgi:molybdopterin-guanine dinucleotide biosynthesis protein A/RimJ/RimL family protein N-acetyltransferase
LASGGLTGILLVGGASRRFGSPKALATLDGETLAERAWRTLGRACDERLAVGKVADDLQLPFELLDDGTHVRAPIAGLVAGLRAASNEIAVVLPVDVPAFRAADLRALAADCPDAAVPPTGPLPAAYRQTALPVLARCLEAGELALRDALRELDVRVVEIDPSVLVNVNTPADLERLEVRIVPFEERHLNGFVSLVTDTLPEFGFEADPGLDPDLDDPGVYYAALWIAERDGAVVGSVALRDLGDGGLELKRMYLRPGERGRGLGKRLLTTAVDGARELGATRIRLDTSERMETAQALYEAYGFQRVHGHAPRQGQSRLLYELRL